MKNFNREEIMKKTFPYIKVPSASALPMTVSFGLQETDEAITLTAMASYAGDKSSGVIGSATFDGTKLNEDIFEPILAIVREAEEDKSEVSRWSKPINQIKVYGEDLAAAFCLFVCETMYPYTYKALESTGALGGNIGSLNLLQLLNLMQFCIKYPSETEKLLKVSPRTIKAGWTSSIVSFATSKKTVPAAVLVWANKQQSPTELIALMQSVVNKEDGNNCVILQDYFSQMKRLKMTKNTWRLSISDFYKDFQILVEMGYSSKKLIDYVIRQDYFYGEFNGGYDVMRNLRDYAQMCETAEISYEKFPQNVFKAHNITMRNLKALKLSEEQKAQFTARCEEAAKLYEVEVDDFVVILPRQVDELVDEGQNLSHCVAGYAKRVASGDTIVGFLRKKDAPQESLYTLEFKGKKVIQSKGAFNADVPEDIEKVIKKAEKKFKV